MTARNFLTLSVIATVLLISQGAWAENLPVIEVAIHAGRFSPETLKVPAHRKFKLRVINRGPAVEEFESTDLNREQIVVPGRSIIVYIGPLEPGQYRFFGDFHPATAQGVMIAQEEKS